MFRKGCIVEYAEVNIDQPTPARLSPSTRPAAPIPYNVHLPAGNTQGSSQTNEQTRDTRGN